MCSTVTVEQAVKGQHDNEDAAVTLTQTHLSRLANATVSIRDVIKESILEKDNESNTDDEMVRRGVVSKQG